MLLKELSLEAFAMSTKFKKYQIYKKNPSSSAKRCMLCVDLWTKVYSGQWFKMKSFSISTYYRELLRKNANTKHVSKLNHYK
jgi:hypothetical protein